ncbi:ABC transporter permease, partial [Mycobacterium sp. MBM]|nr:ABC transporter permease [Mycobacterium sp. MBM]
MAGKGPDRWSPGIAIARNASGPMQAVGGLFAMSADAVKYLF